MLKDKLYGEYYKDTDMPHWDEEHRSYKCWPNVCEGYNYMVSMYYCNPYAMIISMIRKDDLYEHDLNNEITC